MNFNERLKRIRATRKMTQEQLAEASGLSLPAIRKYELSARAPKRDQVMKLANALDVSINVFNEFELETVSDTLSLIFKLCELSDIQIEADQDMDGNYIPESVHITLNNDTLKDSLCSYKKALETKEQLVAAKETYSESEYESKLKDVNQNLFDFENLLLDDTTVLDRDTVADSSEIPVALAKPMPANFRQSPNAELQDLLIDCSNREADIIVSSAKFAKEMLRKK